MKKSKHSLLFLLLTGVLSACSFPTLGVSGTIPQATTTSIPQAGNAPSLVPTATSVLPAGMPVVETDFSNTLSILQNGEFSYMANLAQEKYDAGVYSVPGTLTFTVAFPASETIYLNYGWCAKDATTLQQNLQHINLSFSFNGQQIPNEYVTTLSSKSDNSLECTNAGMLLSGWQTGNYQFRVVANFDEKVNDGISDYEAGDYISEYHVTVQ